MAGISAKYAVVSTLLTGLLSSVAFAAEPESFEQGPRAIFEAKCFKCHGEDRTKLKAELDLRSVDSMLRGGESGAAVVAGKPDDSLIWQMIDGGEMPPKDNPALTESERTAIKAWIAAGAKSNAKADAEGPTAKEKDFWSFRKAIQPALPDVNSPNLCAESLDRFVLSQLEGKQLSFADEADRRTLVRRLYLDLIGLPPTPEQVKAFLADEATNAYEKLVDQLLASPQYGERWGRQWLDVVGYADSNGYIRHDSPRPLAYRYRDYVIRSLNDDKPYDQFWREQLAGDELVDYPNANELTPQQVEMLVATHFLRNAPDGTDDTEGNEATRVMERYAVLESQLQITMSSMFGVTIDCARCHSHKFDPIPHRDYYALQAILYPAFNVKDWTQPKKRWIYAAGKTQLSAWKSAKKNSEAQIAELQQKFEDWLVAQSPSGQVIWQDDFVAGSLAANWSDTAPKDDKPAGKPSVQLDSNQAPAAQIESGSLAVIAAPPGNGAWLVTKQAFDWAPDKLGQWVEVTFDLVANSYAGSTPAERIGYYIALHDFDDSKDSPKLDSMYDTPKGNILIDGDPAGGAQVHLDYPGKDQQPAGEIGTTGYQPGHNYGVRITRVGKNEFLLQHLVDGHAEEKTVRLSANHLPAGGFGFELSCGRSFVVDHVVVKTSEADGGKDAVAPKEFAKDVERQQRKLKSGTAAIEAKVAQEPEKLAWVTDLTDHPPEVPLLKRGDYFSPGQAVTPAPLSVLVDDDNRMEIAAADHGSQTTGRRLAFAKWATKPDSRAAALLARVEVDRIWRGHFGQGLVPTPENFGASGVAPTNPALLEWLTAEFMENGWRLKPLHRQIVLSRAYRQVSNASEAAVEHDPENLLYSRFPARRVDAETIRDSMLVAAGVINLKQFGPAIDFVDNGNRQITLPDPKGEGPHEVDRRSIYLRYRRSQPNSFLQAFDQASPEPNCISRPTSTVVAQSLAMINGEFAMRMGREFAHRIDREAASEANKAQGGATPEGKIRYAFQVALNREPSAKELERCGEFLTKQTDLREEQGGKDPKFVALADLCRMLLATSEFVYLQ